MGGTYARFWKKKCKIGADAPMLCVLCLGKWCVTHMDALFAGESYSSHAHTLKSRIVWTLGSLPRVLQRVS